MNFYWAIPKAQISPLFLGDAKQNTFKISELIFASKSRDYTFKILFTLFFFHFCLPILQRFPPSQKQKLQLQPEDWTDLEDLKFYLKEDSTVHPLTLVIQSPNNFTFIGLFQFNISYNENSIQNISVTLEHQLIKIGDVHYLMKVCFHSFSVDAFKQNDQHPV